MAALLLAVSEPDLPNPVTRTRPAGATGRQALQQSIIYLSLFLYHVYCFTIYDECVYNIETF